MRRIPLFALLCTLAFSGCFDQAVTLGLECESDRECGEGQACGPGVLEDDGSPTPGQVCGIPEDEGWNPCERTDSTTCADHETALICRNGFRTQMDCDVVCEARNVERDDGLCGADVPEVDDDCACAFEIDPTPDTAPDCVRTETGIHTVRSTTFESDDVAAYLDTCDEWCASQSGFDIYSGSVCMDRFEELLRNLPMAISSAVLGASDPMERCACRLAVQPTCDGGQPLTRCLGQDSANSAVAVCAGNTEFMLQCADGCGTVGSAEAEFAWCL